MVSLFSFLTRKGVRKLGIFVLGGDREPLSAVDGVDQDQEAGVGEGSLIDKIKLMDRGQR